MRFSDQIVLIAGATGNIGQGAVRAFLRQGATVLITSRSEERLLQMKGLLGESHAHKLFAVPVDITTPDGCERVRTVIENRVKRLDHVVACTGPQWKHSTLVQTSLEQYDTICQTSLTAHFLLWRAFIPMLQDQPDSSYTIVTSAAGEKPTMAGLSSVMAAAVIALSQVCRNESQAYVTRVNELRIAGRVTNDEHYATLAPGQQSQVMKSSEFGQIFPAVAQQKSLRGGIVHVDMRNFQKTKQELQ